MNLSNLTLRERNKCCHFLFRVYEEEAVTERDSVRRRNWEISFRRVGNWKGKQKEKRENFLSISFFNVKRSAEGKKENNKWNVYNSIFVNHVKIPHRNDPLFFFFPPKLFLLFYNFNWFRSPLQEMPKDSREEFETPRNHPKRFSRAEYKMKVNKG